MSNSQSLIGIRSSSHQDMISSRVGSISQRKPGIRSCRRRTSQPSASSVRGATWWFKALGSRRPWRL